MVLHERQPLHDCVSSRNVDRVLMICSAKLSKQRIFVGSPISRGNIPTIARPLERRLQVPRGRTLSSIKPFILRVLGDVVPAFNSNSLKGHVQVRDGNIDDVSISTLRIGRGAAFASRRRLHAKLGPIHSRRPPRVQDSDSRPANEIISEALPGLFKAMWR